MEFIKLTEHQYLRGIASWNQRCENFWQTTYWQEYVLNSRFGVNYKNHSFFIKQNNEVVGIVPLIQENDELFSPGFDDRKEILQEIKRIAVENGIKRIRVNSEIKSYLDCSTYTCILDLEKISPTKGHRSCIKKAEKYLTYELSCDTEKFKQDYYRIAGKITRPSATFDILLDWIWEGFGTMLEAKLDGQTVGYTYILHYKDRAYYFMSCVEPEFREYNVTHFLLWKAFELLRDKGIKQIELGQQFYPSLHCQPSDKEMNISKFKRGFGGEIVRSTASEYYFDPEFFEQVYSERIKRYKERI